MEHATFKKLVFLLPILALSGTAGFYYSRKDPDEPEAIAVAYRRALLTGDANTIIRLSSPQEMNDNGMSLDDMRRFLVEWVQPRLIRVIDEDSYDVYGSGASGFQTYGWSVATKKGRVKLTVNVAKIDGGLKVVGGLSALLGAFAGIREDGGLHNTRGSLYYAYMTNFPRLAQELKPYHISMIRPNPLDKPVTFEQFAAHWKSKYIQATSRGS